MLQKRLKLEVIKKYEILRFVNVFLASLGNSGVVIVRYCNKHYGILKFRTVLEAALFVREVVDKQKKSMFFLDEIDPKSAKGKKINIGMEARNALYGVKKSKNKILIKKCLLPGVYEKALSAI